MASEVIVADHPTSSEHVKEEVNEEVKASESEIISPAKGSEEVEKPKTEDSLPTPAVPLAESEDAIEANPIETPLVKLKKTVEEKKLKAEELVTPVAPLAEAEDKVEDKNIEPSIVEEEMKTVEEEKPIAAVAPTSKSEDSSPTTAVPSEAPLAEAQDKVEDKKIEPSVIEEEKKIVEEEKPIAEVAPTLKVKPKCDDSSSLAVVLAESEEVEVEPPVTQVKQAIEEVQVSAAGVVPSVKLEPKVDGKKIEPLVVEEVKIADEPLVVEEKIAAETHVVEELEIVAQPPVVVENIVVEPPTVEERLIQTPLVEETKDTTEQLVVEEKIAIETPVVEPKIATETPLLKEKIVIDPSVVEEKIVETPIVEEANSKTETPIVKEVKHTTENPEVEGEKDIIVPTVADEVKNITEPAVLEEVKYTTEPSVLEEVKKADGTPVVVALVDDKSTVAQECTAEPDTPDVMEPEAKIVDSQLVTETSELPEAEEQKAELVVEKQIQQPKAEGDPESSIWAVDTKEQAVDLPKESEPALVKNVEEVLETLTDVVEKPQEYVVVETKESVEDSADKVDDIKLSKEEDSAEASLETKSLLEATLPTNEGQTDAKEEIAGGKADLVEELSKEEAVTLVMVEDKNKAKDLETDSAHPKTKEAEEVVKSILEGAITCREVELVAENGTEYEKSETVTPIETYTNGTVENKAYEKPDETKLEKPEAEAKGEDTVPTDETKDLDEKITSRYIPKEVVRIKSTQKQSNTILSKVKNTLVKAKKAIIGKSTNTKTPSSEPKGEIKV